jgi:hypothetical protein
MNDDLARFEEQLQAIRVRENSGDVAEVFYRCGYQAARAASKRERRHPRTVPFVGETLSEIAASLLVLAGWSALPSTDHDAPSGLAIQNERPSQPDSALEPNHHQDRSADQTDDAGELFEALQLAFRVPWNWGPPDDSLPATRTQTAPLSPVANRQWLSVIED